MKRFLLALLLLLVGGLSSTASAHHGWGWGGWGHRYGGYYGGGIGYGYGGYGGGWGGYYPYAYRGFGYAPRVAYYSNYYAPAYGGYYDTYYAPAYYSPRYYAPAYYYPSCQTTYYSNVIAASTVPPAEYYYGPQAVQRFLGTPPVNNVASNDAANAVQLAAAIVKALKPEQQVINQPEIFIPKDSLPLARSRARKTMALGDRYFGEQNYYQATLKYREAARTAPDLAEAHFRLAHAETALGRFAPAAAAYRQALAANPDVTRDNFNLNELYGEDQIAKGSHLEGAAEAALQATDDTSLLLVVGMFLRYDGQEDRAVKFLRKAWELGDRAPHLARYWGAEENGKVLVADQET